MLISVLVTFVVIILILYLINMLPRWPRQADRAHHRHHYRRIVAAEIYRGILATRSISPNKKAPVFAGAFFKAAFYRSSSHLT
jgi:Tfp pilus assembly protein PilV